MNPAIAAAIAQSIAGIIEIWRVHASKPPEWTPTPEEWDALLALNEKTAADYKAEAARLLGIALPPDNLMRVTDPVPDVPQAPV